MIDAFLRSKLDRVIRRQRWLVLARTCAACWAAGALLAAVVVMLERQTGSILPGALPLIALIAIGTALALGVVQWRRPKDYRAASRRIEAAYPELKGVLLTAVEQPLDDRAPDFLRQRVLHDAIARSQEHDWRDTVSRSRLIAMVATQTVALAFLVLSLGALHRLDRQGAAERRLLTGENLDVKPGDATLERGESLVVLARFNGRVPANVTMVVRESGAAPKSIALVKSLADPVFGGTVANVQQGFTYRLEYGGARTRDFAVAVYEFPRLERADATLSFPKYTALPPKQIEDTTRLSAVEGTRVDLALHLNKPVRRAELVPRDGKQTSASADGQLVAGLGEAGPGSATPATTGHADVVPLRAKQAVISATPEEGRPAAVVTGWVPSKSGTYDLVLVDADGRKNKAPIPFVVEVQPNRPPEIKLASPRGDVRPSALEELTFEGTVWDDFGTIAYGLAYTGADGETKSIELGRGGAAREKQTLHYVLPLESIGVKPDELVAWHVWADDIGPDGKVRRTAGDLYFAEVRPFDEVYRESQMQNSADAGAAGQNGGNETRRLVELQKQILTATWNLQRQSNPPTKDVEVVRDSQQQALQQAVEQSADVRSPRERGTWAAVTRDMKTALEKLNEATKSAPQVAQALPPEQAAYQSLLRLQSRETQVTRGQRGRGGSNRGQASQRQIDQLDLQQAENRYETQRQAQAPQNPQQQEQLAVMNRLQDLARRQQDLNARLQELQTALQEAKTEQEREELRQRLKRLEDEQRQMLADADELRQRMERPDNQSALSRERQQLDRARDDLQRAADAAGQGSPAQALASGTRAQRQLQQARDDLRQQSSNQFSQDLREMRRDARELSRQQEQLDQRIAEAATGGRQQKSLSGGGGQEELAQQAQEQRERWHRLFDRARQMSEQTENSEPLVSKQLYDSVRKATQADDASVAQLQQDLLGRGELTYDLRDRLEQAAKSPETGKALQLTGEMLREGNVPAAADSARRASTQVEELRRGVERAAESVLGDDAEQLKLARSELEELTNQLQREAAAQGEPPADRGTSQKSGPQARDSSRIASSEAVGGALRPDSSAQQGDQRPERSQAESRDENAKSASASRPDAAGQQTGPGAGQRQRQDRVAQNSRRGGTLGSRDSAAKGGDLETMLNQLGDNQGRAGSEDGRGGGGGAAYGGPLTGDTFGPWTDRLRDVEQLLDSPDLRDRIAAARERARAFRRDYTQSRRKPDWAVVQLQVVRPLVEVRNRVAEELARHETKDSLAPIDHDPVPNRFAESVRRYYEELGKGAAPAVTPPAR